MPPSSIEFKQKKLPNENPKKKKSFQFWCTLIAVVCLDTFSYSFFYHINIYMNNPIRECQVFVVCTYCTVYTNTNGQWQTTIFISRHACLFYLYWNNPTKTSTTIKLIQKFSEWEIQLSQIHHKISCICVLYSLFV